MMIVLEKGKEKMKMIVIIIDDTNLMFVTVVIVTIIIITIIIIIIVTIIIVTIIILFLLEKNYKYTSTFWNLNPEGKQRWNIVKNHHRLTPKELEDWGHCGLSSKILMTVVLLPQQLHTKGTVIPVLLLVLNGLINIIFLLRRRRRRW
jgi:hypothetical protein